MKILLIIIFRLRLRLELHLEFEELTARFLYPGKRWDLLFCLNFYGLISAKIKCISILMFRENDVDNVTFLWLKMKLDIENWLKIIEPVALFPYQKHLWFIKSSWEIFIVNILEVSGETQRCNFTSRYGNYYLNDFGFFLYSDTSQFKEIWKKFEAQKYSRFHGTFIW